MVASMKKIVFIAFHREWEQFLHELRELGMVHVVEHDRSDVDEDELQQFINRAKQLQETAKKLNKYIDKKSKEPLNASDLELGKRLPQMVEDIENEKSHISQKIQIAKKERDTLAHWGNFNPSDIKKIEDAGYKIQFFVSPNNLFNPEWEDQHDLFVIKREASKIYFVTISRGADLSEVFDLEEENLPDVSLNELNKLIESLSLELSHEDEKMRELAKDLPSVNKAIEELESEIRFIKVKHSGEAAAENKIILLQGWTTEENLSDVCEYLDNKSVYYEIFDPQPEDDVPIKFKNNKFVKLFEPIAELYELPSYNEIDLTPYFAPFYMIFFGLSLGDIGYGIFLLLVASLVKMIKKGSIPTSLRGAMTLIQILGASTMVCGLLQGGFFGINIYDLNSEFFRNLKDIFYLDNQAMFALSLILGVVQILFGMFIKIFNKIKQFGIKYALSSIGWFVFILSFVASYLMSSVMPMGGTVHTVIMILSGILIVFFNSPDKNIFVNIGSSLWDAYNMATGLLGDILSYVRLFALGLSGGILANVFTNLSTGMSPDNAIVGPIVTILIFLAGHAINIFMNALGAFVHPLRLTFVEFYKNSDFTGGGKKFTPFKD